ncbi:MAG: quinone-dependent dihydroorotate dehydrogenase [Chitinophagaceae bacterium]|nr:MAG: quinone-dependent dihydroorotate dehydrogenase [Chitinophagaceae bacterium]
MYWLIKKILFLFPPEKAHHIAMGGLNIIRSLPGGKSILKKYFCFAYPMLKKEVFGITFPNPVGLAAGFDKDAKWIDSLECLGFGFMEIGTVTPLPQPGNEKPRLFRLPKDRALINRMGFNNEGAEAAALRIKKSHAQLIIGGNIGKNKITPNENAAEDYEKCFHALYDVVDYFVINVSSPNTPGLRSLQEKEPLQRLILRLQNLNKQKPVPRPILLKIAPDLNEGQLNDIISIVLETGLSGIVATNTTIGREGLRTPSDRVQAMGAGGLSGKPLQKKSTEIIRYLYQKTNGLVPIIASGGIFNAADAKEKLDAGAALVQVYTGFIYEGPGIAKKICKRLAE